MAGVRLAIISDLHYENRNGKCLPAVCDSGIDSMKALREFLQGSEDLKREDGSIADYLICPGDITTRADPKAFSEGWRNLNDLKTALGAKDLVATTGNHEVVSRADDASNIAGNVEASLDPLYCLQAQDDYPSPLLSNEERWVYWGRGYQIVSTAEIVILIVNSSHYHPTTRQNEYERGRIGLIALEHLKKDLKDLCKKRDRAYIALMHHNPVVHEEHGLGKVIMDNGQSLMDRLGESEVPWIVVHGHKHHGRLLRSAGDSLAPIIFSAGSFGANIGGMLAASTSQQFYLLDLDVDATTPMPTISGRVRAFSWDRSSWIEARKRKDGLPDHCGFISPPDNINATCSAINQELMPGVPRDWSELSEKVKPLKHLLPGDLSNLKSALNACGIKVTWDESEWFPQDLSK